MEFSSSILFNYFLIVLTISGVCLGWRMITDDEKIFYPIRKYVLDRYDIIPKFISKPLILCEACFSSIWGSVIYWALWGVLDGVIDKSDILFWVFSCFTASFINGILWSLYELIRKY